MMRRITACLLAFSLLVSTFAIPAAAQIPRDGWTWVNYQPPAIQLIAKDAENLYLVIKHETVTNYTTDLNYKDRQFWLYQIDRTGTAARYSLASLMHLHGNESIDNRINTLVPDGGSVWLGTTAGPFRLKGGEIIEHYELTNKGISENVRVIYRATGGSLWFGTSNGIAKLDNEGKWTVYTPANSPLPQGVMVSDIAEGKDGSMWFGCGSGTVEAGSGFGTSDIDRPTAVLKLKSDGTWLTYQLEPYTVTPRGGAVYPTPLGFAPADDGGMYVQLCGSDALLLLKEAENQLLPVQASAAAGKAIMRRADSRGCMLTDSKAVPRNDYWNTLADQGTVYAAHGTIVEKYGENGKETVYTIHSYPQERARKLLHADLDFSAVGTEINAVKPDRAGGYWLATTAKGVVHLVDSKVEGVYDTANSVLPDNNVIDVELARDGSLWMATQFGVAVVRPDGRQEVLNKSNPSLPKNIRDIVFAPDGTVWLLTYWSEGTYHLGSNGTILEIFDLPGHPYLIGGETAAMESEADGTLWVASHFNRGVAKIESGETVRYLAYQDNIGGTGFDKVFVRDADGTLWLFNTERRKNLYSPHCDYDLAVLRPNCLLEVNGAPVISDVDPYIHEDTTMVPLRVISEALGFTPEWNSAARTVTIKGKGQEIVLTIGSRSAMVNGVEKTLATAPEITGGRTFVPLRFISENLGAQVDWDSEFRRVIISR